jgi:hypothetical protein
MRNIIILLAGLICLNFYSCDDKTPDKAIEYNEFLMKSINPVVAKMADFEEAVYVDDSQKLEDIRRDFSTFVVELREKINAKEAFDGNERFKSAALEMLNFYGAVSEKHYLDIISLKQKDLRLKDETVDKIEDIIWDIYKKENVLYEKFEQEANLYARKYGFHTNNNLSQKKH